MKAILIILILLLGILTVGCAQAERPYNRTTNTISPPTDTEITTKVNADLKARGLQNIQVETINGEVRLTGYVEDDVQKAVAEQTARTTAGVNRVTVNIDVQKRPPVNSNTKLGPRRGEKS